MKFKNFAKLRTRSCRRMEIVENRSVVEDREFLEVLDPRLS
jgi:hypothetical protein